MWAISLLLHCSVIWLMQWKGVRPALWRLNTKWVLLDCLLCMESVEERPRVYRLLLATCIYLIHAFYSTWACSSRTRSQIVPNCSAKTRVKHFHYHIEWLWGCQKHVYKEYIACRQRMSWSIITCITHILTSAVTLLLYYILCVHAAHCACPIPTSFSEHLSICVIYVPDAAHVSTVWVVLCIALCVLYIV